VLTWKPATQASEPAPAAAPAVTTEAPKTDEDKKTEEATAAVAAAPMPAPTATEGMSATSGPLDDNLALWDVKPAAETGTS
jgi:hypothetical protein